MIASIKRGRVWVSEADVYAFNRRWPGSNLHGLAGFSVEFDREGDLVDIDYTNGSPDDWDGPALLALVEDAQEYLNQRITTPRHRRVRG